LELWGNLKDFSLPDVIQLVGFGRKTGVLSVEYKGMGSMLFFEEGNVVHAVADEIEGEEAVYRLFRLEDGEFRFQADIAAPRRTIFMDPTNLVMEAARLLDESSRDSAEQEGYYSGEELLESDVELIELPEASEVSDADIFGTGFDTAHPDGIIEVEQEPEPVADAPQPIDEALPRKSPDEARAEITKLLETKFGRDAKRLTQAVKKCGDTIEEFQELVVRVERFVSAFVDPGAARQVGDEIRAITERLSV